jgi:hypothetical protein
MSNSNRKKNDRLYLLRALARLVTVLVLFNPGSSAGQNICRPAIVVDSTQFGSVQAQQRVWKGMLSIDANQCASGSGAFELGFIRERENAPDLQFIERFTWTAGQMEISVSFWQDEFVSKYWIHKIAPCACRQ